ncbi:MAG: Rieske 2Fe-2S domain-containing protein [Thermoplasmata archaeon]|nr:Rieske 2Fe-2S domain-containing protein [Thermoplasmata archaeon]
MTWHATGVAVGTLPTGSMREVHLNDAPVLLVRVAGAVRAVDAICPHEGGILADGSLSGDRIACPVHGATFDGLTGRVLVDPDGVEPPQGGVVPLVAYATRVVEGMVEVDLPE